MQSYKRNDRKFVFKQGLLYFLLLLSLNTRSQVKLIESADIIIRNVNVLTMTDSGILENEIVCIKDDKIIFIGKDTFHATFRTKGLVVSGLRKFLMPGLADMHCHFPNESAIDRYFLMNLAAGVTTLRSMRGELFHLNLKNRKTPHPTLFLSAPPITGKVAMTDSYTDSLFKVYKQLGFDFIKVLSIRDSLSFKTVMKYAKRYDLSVCGHMLGNINDLGLLNSGYNSIEHFTWQAKVYDEDKMHLNKIVSAAKQNSVFFCPTLDYYQIAYRQVENDKLLNRLGMNFIHDSVKKNWITAQNNETNKLGLSKIEELRNAYLIEKANQFEAMRICRNGKIRLLLGLDADMFSVPGFSIIEEMKLFQLTGFNNYEILEAATVNAARYLKEEDKWGTIASGKLANLILLTQNPLVSIDAVSKVELVLLDGKIYSAVDLKNKL